MIGLRTGIIASSRRPTLDPDAQAFITAASITDITQQGAINTFVLSLKSANIWTKMLAIYPIVGGDATKHSFNLKDPTTFQITNGEWSSGVTHSSTGALPDGLSGYGDSGLNASSSLTIDDFHFSIYLRTNTTTDGCDIGTWDSTEGSLDIYAYYAGGSYFQYPIVSLSTRISTTTGMFLGSCKSSNSNFIQNTTSLVTSSSPNTGMPNNTVTLFQLHGRGNLSNRECAGASIGFGLTTVEIDNLYTCYQNFNTTLSRQV